MYSLNKLNNSRDAKIRYTQLKFNTVELSNHKIRPSF